MIRIHVTQKHIDKAIERKKKGNFSNETSCPIALAIRDVTHQSTSVSSSSNVCINNKEYIVRTKKKQNQVDRFIGNFDNDNHGVCRSFKFDLERINW